MQPTGTTIALIVAAGGSSRFGGVIPKPYIALGGKPVLRRTLEAFLTHPKIDGVRVVISRTHHGRYRQITDGLKLFPCVIGGETRQESVRRGLESIERVKPTRVLIHDAARPMVSHAMIDRVLQGLESRRAILPAIPVRDTLKYIEGGRVTATVSREQLVMAQTPQGFYFDDIFDAHRRFTAMHVTDDVALAELAGIEVGVVDGDAATIKLTTQEDHVMMEAAVKEQRETRVGMGFDVHAFGDHDAEKPSNKRTIPICGVKVPHEQKLIGHSDADVGLHALVDAILGAIGAGDIGMHFPHDDRTWQGADSSRFLLHAYQLLKSRGGDLVNIDITIIGERPKIAPHREEMINRIASLLKISPARVSVKATTTEKLGFLGRAEALAAQAVATVTLPALYD